MKNKIWIGVAVLLVLALAVFSWRRHRPARIEYREAKVHYGDLEVTILSTGAVAPENKLAIKSSIAGRAEEVLVNEGDKVKKGQELLLMSSTERAALIDAARAKGPAVLKEWEEYYKTAAVLAPIDGTIIIRNIQPGQSFATTDAILTMSDRLIVQASIDETDLAQIHLHQKATIVLDAYPGKEIPAVVDKIAYDAVTTNNVTTYQVYVLPNFVPSYMRSGMTANVNFLVKSKKHVLLVPNEAIKKNDDDDSFVSVKNPAGDPPTIHKSIEVGDSDGKDTEVLSGLSDGESVDIAELKKASALGDSPFGLPHAPGKRK